MHHRCRVEPLEARLALAAQVSYIDVDGDEVTITSSRGDLLALNAALDFKTVGVGQQLEGIDLAANPVFAGTALTITAKPGLIGGDGFVNVGFINATNLDLGSVRVGGDLGKLTVGNTVTPGLAFRSLDVQSLGLFGTSTGAPDVFTLANDAAGTVTVRTDVVGARVDVAKTLSALRIGGSVIGDTVAKPGRIAVGGDVGSVSIGGSLQGGSAQSTGFVSLGGSVRTLSIGGGIIGGSGQQSGRVEVLGASAGTVSIRGSIVGGTGNNAGSIQFTRVNVLSVGGDVVGGTDGGTGTGEVLVTNSVARLQVGGSVFGGAGTSSGRIVVNTLNALGVRAASIRGSVVGGGGAGSGVVSCFGQSGTLSIGQDLRGGAGAGSGAVTADSLQQLSIGGSVFSSIGVGSGGIRMTNTVGAIRIGGVVAGTAAQAAVITAGAAGQAIGSLSVGGRMERTLVLAGYSSVNPPVGTAAGSIGSVTVGGDLVASSIVAGVRNPAFPNFGDAADVAIPSPLTSRIGSITVRGAVMGTVGGGDHFGFVAEQIGSVTIGRARQTIPPPNAVEPIGATSDFTIHVVAPA